MPVTRFKNSWDWGNSLFAPGFSLFSFTLYTVSQLFWNQGCRCSLFILCFVASVSSVYHYSTAAVLTFSSRMCLWTHTTCGFPGWPSLPASEFYVFYILCLSQIVLCWVWASGECETLWGEMGEKMQRVRWWGHEVSVTEWSTIQKGWFKVTVVSILIITRHEMKMESSVKGVARCDEHAEMFM